MYLYLLTNIRSTSKSLYIYHAPGENRIILSNPHFIFQMSLRENVAVILESVLPMIKTPLLFHHNLYNNFIGSDI